jgi:hypothetical protein
MDSWVTTDMMKLETTEYDQAAAERELAGAGRSRQQKRRDEPPPAHGGNVGHAADEVRLLRCPSLPFYGAQRCNVLRALRFDPCACAALQPAAPITPLRRKRHLKSGGTGAAAKARQLLLRVAARHAHAPAAHCRSMRSSTPRRCASTRSSPRFATS